MYQTGKTQVANNSKGILVCGNMKKYTGKNPFICICLCIKACRTIYNFGPDSFWLDSVSCWTKIFQS